MDEDGVEVEEDGKMKWMDCAKDYVRGLKYLVKGTRQALLPFFQ